MDFYGRSSFDRIIKIDMTIKISRNKLLNISGRGKINGIKQRSK